MAKITDRNDYWFIKKNPITKVGVFDYLGSQISEDCEPNRIYKVLRPAEELFKKETLDSLHLLPLINNHEMLGKDTKSGIEFTPAEDKGVEGVLGEQVSHDSDTIYTDIKIYSDDLKEQIKNGKKELSLGYFCTYDKQEGTYKGQKYDYVQRNIIGNHLALVDRGRMGADVRVYDSKVFAMDSIAIDKDEDIQWITVRGTHIPIKNGESKEQAVKNFLDGKKEGSSKINNEDIDKKALEMVKKEFGITKENEEPDGFLTQAQHKSFMRKREILKQRASEKTNKETNIKNTKGSSWDDILNKIQKQGYELDDHYYDEEYDHITALKDGKEYEIEITKYSNGDYEVIGSGQTGKKYKSLGEFIEGEPEGKKTREQVLEDYLKEEEELQKKIHKRTAERRKQGVSISDIYEENRADYEKLWKKRDDALKNIEKQPEQTEKKTEKKETEEKLNDSQKMSARAYYKKEFKSDKSMHNRVSEKSIHELYEDLRAGKFDYEDYGDDSIVRERIFDAISRAEGVDYDDVYYMWLKKGEKGAGNKLSQKYRQKHSNKATDSIEEYKNNKESKMAQDKEQVVYDSVMELLENKVDKETLDKVSQVLAPKAKDEDCNKDKNKVQEDEFEENVDPKLQKEDKKDDDKEDDKKDVIEKKEDKKEVVEVEDEDEDKKELKKVKEAVDGMPEQVIKAIAKRDTLGKAVVNLVGTFDYSNMTVKEVAKYACDKLDIQAEEGNEVATLDGYIKGAQRRNNITVSYKVSINGTSDKAFEKFMKGE